MNLNLTGDEVALAIYAYLTAHDAHVSGPATITVNGERIKRGKVYVDPSGFVIADGVKHSGKGNNEFKYVADAIIEELEETDHSKCDLLKKHCDVCYEDFKKWKIEQFRK